ncbi:hypothetical protein SAMN05216366_15310 [Selenomonas ruminantium]|uniref:Uncharacterized protein n=1 Tax=Selenomonas ruminantium TaxID=971 RepID=A0A1H0VFP6_SELRU|nr:hypothetical protein SAMN05216366_15310 [Selenomonas ruminantium]
MNNKPWKFYDMVINGYYKEWQMLEDGDFARLE